MRGGNERCAFGEFCSFPCLFSFLYNGVRDARRECSDIIVIRTAGGFQCPYQRARCRLEAIIFIPLINERNRERAYKPAAKVQHPPDTDGY